MQRSIKITAAATAAAAAMIITGCSNNPTQAEGTTLTMFAASDYKAAVDPLISDFEKANPGVKINVTYAGGNDFETTEGTALASGHGPDIIDALPGATGAIASQTLIKEGKILDLSDQPWAKDVPASVNAQNIPDLPDKQKVHLYPVLIQPMGAFYNKKALSDTGLNAPTTWSELIKFCGDAKAAGKGAYSLGISDQWITQLIPYSLANTLVYGKDPDWGRNGTMKSGQVKLTESKWVETFQKYDEMNKAGCFTADPNAVNLDNSLAPVATGKALGIVQVGALFGNLQSLNKNVEYQLKPLPATDNPADTYMPAAPAHEFGVNAASKNKDLAVKFINFLAEPANVNKFVTTIGGAVPAVPNNDFKPPAVLTDFNEYVKNDKIRPFPYLEAESANALMVGTQNMFLGKQTPESVVADMQAVATKG
jgi:raffinose/stachyose/melibiose transport system substrate-binding protein